jgi:cytochrome c oxidase cbb3-type subunit I/II
MVVAGITQGMMWRAVDETGRLVYPDFVETVMRIIPLYYVRAVGGLLFFVGYILMVINVVKTLAKAPRGVPPETFRALSITAHPEVAGAKPHRKLEGMGLAFSLLTFLAIIAGSVIEIVPTLSINNYIPNNVTTIPYTALEQAGRDIYVKEGCYVCHSQMIRKMPSEVLRWGPASTIAESRYDRPFQWGSKRTGPDLARVGGKYPDLWHLRHMVDPRSTTQNSVMPPYPWLVEKKVDFLILRKKLQIMSNLGVPYTQDQIVNADIDAEKQALAIAQGLGDEKLKDKQIVALIAYLQSIGKKTVEGSNEARSP